MRNNCRTNVQHCQVIITKQKAQTRWSKTSSQSADKFSLETFSLIQAVKKNNRKYMHKKQKQKTLSYLMPEHICTLTEESSSPCMCPW